MKLLPVLFMSSHSSVWFPVTAISLTPNVAAEQTEHIPASWNFQSYHLTERLVMVVLNGNTEKETVETLPRRNCAMHCVASIL